MGEKIKELKRIIMDLEDMNNETTIAVKAFAALCVGADDAKYDLFGGDSGEDLRWGMKRILDLIVADQNRVFYEAYHKAGKITDGGAINGNE